VVGDLVLCRKQKIEGLHKLASHWECPYMVKAVTRPTSYRLCDLNIIDVQNSLCLPLIGLPLRRFYAWSATRKKICTLFLLQVFSKSFISFCCHLFCVSQCLLNFF
jgi:hypothetical protein